MLHRLVEPSSVAPQGPVVKALPFPWAASEAPAYLFTLPYILLWKHQELRTSLPCISFRDIWRELIATAITWITNRIQTGRRSRGKGKGKKSTTTSNTEILISTKQKSIWVILHSANMQKVSAAALQKGWLGRAWAAAGASHSFVRQIHPFSGETSTKDISNCCGMPAAPFHSTDLPSRHAAHSHVEPSDLLARGQTSLKLIFKYFHCRYIQ